MARPAPWRPCEVRMDKQERIFVAGHRGLAGSAIVRCLRAQGFDDLLLPTHAELDLTDSSAVRAFFVRERPAVVFLAAAKVGGIHANNTYPAEFVQQNLAIQTNVIHEAWSAGVEELLFLGSSCIYPRDCQQPIREDSLLSGPLEPTNRPYALAKIAGIEMCWSYNRQHGTRYLAAMPTNMYGPGDNYDAMNSHVLPALIRKCHEARVGNAASVNVWGTGSPLREFLYSDDMARASVYMMSEIDHVLASITSNQPPLINVGFGSDLTIRAVAEIVAQVVGFHGHIAFDRSKPDGTPRKLLDSSRLFALGWKPEVDLRDGIARAYDDFRARFESA